MTTFVMLLRGDILTVGRLGGIHLRKAVLFAIPFEIREKLRGRTLAPFECLTFFRRLSLRFSDLRRDTRCRA
jgi:hypothetical protein